MRAMPLLLACSLPSPVFAATLSVGGGEATHPTIGSALAAAVDGDVIRVSPGTYDEALVIDQDVVLRGAGPGLTTLAPTIAGVAITVTGGADARVELLDIEPLEQGITVNDGSRLVLSMATISGADSESPGAALSIWQGSTVRVETVRFHDNSTSSYGGHVYLDSSWLEVIGSAFVNGRASTGGALTAVDSEVRLARVRLARNEAGAGGAVQAVAESSLTVERATFADNRADGEGGAIAIADSQARLLGVTFEANRAGTTGGAVDLDRGSLDLLDADFHGNAAAEGAAVAIRGDHADFEAVGGTFEGHQASGRGGAVTIQADTGRIGLAELVFRGNQADLGGAVAIVGTSVDVLIEQSIFDGNLAAKGGGALWVDGAAELRLVGNAFTENTSDRSGGAVGLAEVLDAESVANRFCRNTSAWQGGAVHDRYSGHHRWTNNRFTDNRAGTAGGAVAVTFPTPEGQIDAPRGSGPSFVNNAFLRNEATSASAVWLTVWRGSSGMYLDFRNNLVAWNHGHGAVIGDANDMDTAIAWNDFWRTGEPVLGLHETWATSEVQPRLADDGCVASRLRSDSPLVDAGDPSLRDGDGTRSDIGPDGGPLATPEYVLARTDPTIRVPVADRPDPTAPEAVSGGCSTAPAHAAWTFLLLPLLARRRQR